MVASNESIHVPTSVVIPCYNEERRILPTLERVVDFLGGRRQPWEVVVVDDGSSDRTSACVRERFGQQSAVRVLRYESNHGKGFAVREGILASRGNRVLFSDADLSTPIAELAKLERHTEAGFDVVVGSRVAPGSRILTLQPLPRRLSGGLFRSFVRAFGLTAVRDTQCGFKLFRRGAVEPILRRVVTEGFAFDVEMLARAERAGLRVAEVGVEWSDAKGTKLRLFPDAGRMAMDLLRIHRRLAAERALS
jgi:dolichyl-phosphate beta-glucosyltransferase